MALQLAAQKREKAEMAAELARLRAAAQQGTPHLSGSGTPPPSVPDDWGGGGLQG